MDEEKLLRMAKIITAELELKNELSLQFIVEALKAIKIFDDKHTIRGLSGYGDFGPVGVASRLAEKYEQIKEHYVMGEKYNSDVVEKLWLDIAVFGIIGKMVEAGDWE